MSQMSKCSSIALRALLLGAGASVLMPPSGFAHALSGDSDPNRSPASYVWLGFLHMAGGWDHLLFITGVVLVSGSAGAAAKLISLFVAGHSLTLIVATLEGGQLDPTVVDVAIALSLVYVGVQGMRGPPVRLSVMGALVFAFGLVHGLGLSTRLQDLGLPEDGLLVRVVLFNIGVELGQLTALVVIVGVGSWAVRRLELRRSHARLAFGSLIAAGVIAAAVLSLTAREARRTPAPVVLARRGGCADVVATPLKAVSGEHPGRTYYGPEQEAPEGALDHVLVDGLIVVRYRPDVSAADLSALKRFVASSDPPFVIAAADPDQAEVVRVRSFTRAMFCKRVDITQLMAFRAKWLVYLRQLQGG